MKIIIIILFTVFAVSISQKSQAIELGVDQISQVVPNLGNSKIAVLAHAASVSQSGEHVIDIILKSSKNLNLIFAPEHGLRSNQDDYVDDGIDARTGLKIVSLYKRETRAPTNEDLTQFDVLFIDLQDVGMRFYTYSSTAYLTIKKCIENNKKVILLDRLNPIGTKVSGPLLSPDLLGHFISYFNIPQAHGLTIGELLNYIFRDHPNKNLLQIIKLKNWDINLDWHDLNLPWTAPSPALLTLEQAQLYSILGPLESLNLSVGRGQENSKAFKYFGAPWITKEQSQNISIKLNELKINGLYFYPVEWKVTRGIYQDELVNGFKVEIIDFSKINGFKSQYQIVSELFKYFKASLKFNSMAPRYFGGQKYIEYIISGKDYSEIEEIVKRDERAFSSLVHRYRFY